jgi:hypothetical protein
MFTSWGSWHVHTGEQPTEGEVTSLSPSTHYQHALLLKRGDQDPQRDTHDKGHRESNDHAHLFSVFMIHWNVSLALIYKLDCSATLLSKLRVHAEYASLPTAKIGSSLINGFCTNVSYGHWVNFWSDPCDCHGTSTQRFSRLLCSPSALEVRRLY